MTLGEVARELSMRLSRIFLPDEAGSRPCHGGDARYATDPHWRDLVLFHEYFHGDNGSGLGASHQTGWTSLVVRCLDSLAATRALGDVSNDVIRRARDSQIDYRPPLIVDR